MRRFLPFLILLLALPAWGKPYVKAPQTSNALKMTTTVYFSASDADDSDAIGVGGFCYVRATIATNDAVSLYAVTSSTSATSSGVLLTSFTASTSPNNPVYTFTASTQWVKAVATSSSTGGSTLIIECSPLVGSGGADASYAMSGVNMTWQTVEYLSDLKRFEGLDSTIPWTRYWLDPYAGSDSNDGTYSKPFKTFGKWKSMAGFGVWFTVKNGGHGRTMYISDQTFPYPSAEACVIGETVTYDGGSSTSKILDIDVASGKIVFETLTGSDLTAADVITAGSKSGAACAWTVGTREPSIWDGTLALCSTNNLDACSIGDRGTGTGCAAGTCYAASAVQIAQSSAVSSRYEGRITTILDAEDPYIKPVLHGNGRSLGGLDNTGLGTNNERTGIFIGGGTGYGCLGVANIDTDDIIDDAISQHSEGCVRALNVHSDRVLNTSNATQDNIITTHNGTLGRGGVISVNGGGVGYPYTDTAGSPVAPTAGGDSGAYMIVIGGDYVVDGTNQSGTGGLAPMKGSGGRNTFLGVDGWCRNLPGGSSGCQGWTLFNSDGDSTFDFIRSVARTSGTASAAGVSLQGSGSNTIAAKIYRPSFNPTGTPSRGLFINASSGAISIDIRGAIFDGLDFYVYDFSNPATNLTGSISGIYDNDGGNTWHFGNAGADYTTAASAAAASDVLVMEDSYSVQTDATEYTTDFGTRCADAGECWDAYTESWAVQFPEIIYDYLPFPIYGYAETGTRNYGAR